MLTAAELAEHREDAKSLLVDEFSAFEPVGHGVLNESTGVQETVFAPRGVGVVGKVQSRSRVGDAPTVVVNVAGQERPLIKNGLHLSFDATTPSIGWEYECTKAGIDPALVGRRWRVVGFPARTWQTALRLDVVEV